jgi:hypothetical protein
LFSYPAAANIAVDWAANLDLCSALRAFEQGGIFKFEYADTLICEAYYSREAYLYKGGIFRYVRSF